jgi:hypothetical protein
MAEAFVLSPQFNPAESESPGAALLGYGPARAIAA